MNSQRSILYTRLAYTPPPWINHFINPLFTQTKDMDFMMPTSRYNLGQLPTPMHPIPFMQNLNQNNHNENDTLLESSLNTFEFWMKRDDLTSFDISGNKLRKLEFLLADAKDKGHDSVITIGGLQSNHCRATALAAKQLGLKCYLILRTSEPIEKIDLTGNLLFSRLSDATIYTVTPSTYAQIGSVALTHQLRKQLIGLDSNDNHSNRNSNGINEVDQTSDATIKSPSLSTSPTISAIKPNPYIIPVGGSNEIGLYGYLDCVEEIITSKIPFDHVVFACGSGGTATGLGLGFRLAELYSEYSKIEYNKFLLSNLMSSSSSNQNKYEYKKPQVHAMYVCDSAEYFYHHINAVCHNIGINTSTYAATKDDQNKDKTDTANLNGEEQRQKRQQEDPAQTQVGDPRSWLHMHRGVGIGYARSTAEELDFTLRFARHTGILLDPVYSGKAMYYFCKDVLMSTMMAKQELENYNNNNSSNISSDNTIDGLESEATSRTSSSTSSSSSLFKQGQKILFIHTGGVVGLYDKSPQLLPLLQQQQQESSSPTTSTNATKEPYQRLKVDIGNIIKMKIEKP